jgi:hypothetical protein
MNETGRLALLRLFGELQAAFPHLSMRTYTSAPHVDLGIEVVAQPGIEVAMYAVLQGDELLLAVGDFDFVSSWFPLSDAAVVDLYREAVEGFLSGRHRILQYRRWGHAVKADLQRSDVAGWKTIGRFRAGLLPVSWGAKRRVIRNGVSDRAVQQGDEADEARDG